MAKLFKSFFALILVFTLLSCSEESTNTTDEKLTSAISSKVATDWINLSLNLTKTSPGFTPPVGARAFGYTGVALYEAVVPGMPTYNSLSGKINGYVNVAKIETGKEYHWGIVANATLAYMMTNLYPNATAENKTAITDLENKYNTEFKATVSQEVYDRSVTWGKTIAKEIFDYSKTDGQELAHTKNFPTTYTPPTGPGLWDPTTLKQTALQPYWGSVRTFIQDVNTSTLPVAPPAYSEDDNSQYVKEAKEVYDTFKSLTDDQRYIAYFWADDPGKTPTPPGHSMSILSQVLQSKSSNLATAAEAYAKMGMGQHDSFVCCWYAKYVYNYVRPVTVIRQKWDPDFASIVGTPAFPEYPSGHSTQSGTMKTIMSNLFGANTTFTDKTHEGRAIDNTTITLQARTFTSFDQAATETAISRLYGGIHFKAAIENGISQGEKIGNKINQIAFRK